MTLNNEAVKPGDDAVHDEEDFSPLPGFKLISILVHDSSAQQYTFANGNGGAFCKGQMDFMCGRLPARASWEEAQRRHERALQERKTVSPEVRRIYWPGLVDEEFADEVERAVNQEPGDAAAVEDHAPESSGQQRRQDNIDATTAGSTTTATGNISSGSAGLHAADTESSRVARLMAQPTVSRSTDEINGNVAVIGRLCWYIAAPMEEAVFIIPEGHAANDLTNLRPLFSPRGDHPFAHELITAEPKIAFVAGCTALSHWYPNDWGDAHYHHEDAEDCELAPMTEDDESDGGGLAGEIYDEDDQPCLLARCCGETRPNREISSPIVIASDPAQGITIKDYIMTMHPWLLSKLEAFRAYAEILDGTIDKDEKFVVYCTQPDDINARSERNWLEDRQPWVDGRKVWNVRV